MDQSFEGKDTINRYELFIKLEMCWSIPQGASCVVNSPKTSLPLPAFDQEIEQDERSTPRPRWEISVLGPPAMFPV